MLAVPPTSRRGGVGLRLAGQLLPYGEGQDKWGETVVCSGMFCAYPSSLAADVPIEREQSNGHCLRPNSR